MKTVRLLSIAVFGALMLIGCGGGIALTHETVDSVDKIYYAPLKMNRYIVRSVYRIPGDDEEQVGLSKVTTAKKMADTQKGVKEKYQQVDMAAELAVGDTARVGKNPVIILGMIPQEAVDSFNDQMLARLREVLGDKVEFWPEGRFMLEKMDMFGNLYDFKNCDADIYVKITPPYHRIPLTIEITDDFVELPKKTDSSLETSMFSQTIGVRPSSGTIGLFFREEAGGKASKVAGSFAELLSEKHETFELPVSAKIDLVQTYAEIPPVSQEACMKLADAWVAEFEEKGAWSLDYFIKKIVLE
ncbi:hypothetical protein ACFL4U_02645 [Candidatus Neomarinimicrobiota bacterium]